MVGLIIKQPFIYIIQEILFIETIIFKVYGGKSHLFDYFLLFCQNLTQTFNYYKHLNSINVTLNN